MTTHIFTAQQFLVAMMIAVLAAGVAGYFVGRSTLQVRESYIGNKETSSSINSVNDTASLDNSVRSVPTASGGNTIAVENQPAGDSIRIQSARFGAGGGWVAIHEDRDGKPGNVLGAQFYAAGETKGGLVDLLRPTVKGTYYAMLHHDDGDHQFDFTKDFPMTDASGKPVMAGFLVN